MADPLTHHDLIEMGDRIVESFRREVDGAKVELGGRIDDLRDQVIRQNGRVTKAEDQLTVQGGDVRTLRHDFKNHLTGHLAADRRAAAVASPTGIWVLPAVGSRAFYLVVVGAGLILGLVASANQWAVPLVATLVKGK